MHVWFIIFPAVDGVEQTYMHLIFNYGCAYLCTFQLMILIQRYFKLASAWFQMIVTNYIVSNLLVSQQQHYLIMVYESHR